MYINMSVQGNVVSAGDGLDTDSSGYVVTTMFQGCKTIMRKYRINCKPQKMESKFRPQALSFFYKERKTSLNSEFQNGLRKKGNK